MLLASDRYSGGEVELSGFRRDGQTRLLWIVRGGIRVRCGLGEDRSNEVNFPFLYDLAFKSHERG